MGGVRLHRAHSKRIVRDKGAGFAVELPALLASGRKPAMKAFFLGILTAVLLAVGSAVVLQGYVQKPVTEAFSTSSVRI
jgi:high-affinity Fe2+/Pb2+ permease